MRKKGATAVRIFEEIMTAPLYCVILQQTLLPFILWLTISIGGVLQTRI